MEIQFNWVWSASDVRLSEDGLTDVVYNIHYRYQANSEGFFSETYGVAPVGAPNPELFTPYSELTDEIVFGWLESSLPVTEMQENLTKQIELLKNPVTATLPPPSNEAAVPPILEEIIVEPDTSSDNTAL